MITYLLAIFIAGVEAERPPTILAPYADSVSCHSARREADKEIASAGQGNVAYAACLKIERAQPV